MKTEPSKPTIKSSAPKDVEFLTETAAKKEKNGTKKENSIVNVTQPVA